MSSPAGKRQKSSKDTPYQLIYWPGIPGRGEHVRLLLEYASAPYHDLAKTAPAEAVAEIRSLAAAGTHTGDAGNPPVLAPPVLRHGDLVVSQTSNILLYLGRRHGLAGEGQGEGEGGDGDDEDGMYRVNGLALTALDGLSNEVHDTHHPVATGKYYEDQREEAKKKAEDFRAERLPKFLGYFERVLEGEASGEGPWLYGGKVTYADLVLFQCLDGVMFAFPKAMKRMEESGRYKRVWELYEAVKNLDRIKEYLASQRRAGYSNGIYRHYPELDDE